MCLCGHPWALSSISGPLPESQGLVTADTQTALLLGRVIIHFAPPLETVSAALEPVPSHTDSAVSCDFISGLLIQ